MNRSASAGVGALALIALSGLAVGSAVLFPGEPPSPLPDPGVPVTAHRKAGLVPEPSALPLGVHVLQMREGNGRAITGGEPSIGADSEGALYVAGPTARVWKSVDAGGNWTDVSRPFAKADRDPYLSVDRDASPSRIWSAPLSSPCVDIMWSDDGGGNWTRSETAVMCGGGAQDHPSLVSGPAPEGVSAANGRIAYYTYNQMGNGKGWVVRSLDGGRSWEGSEPLFDGACQAGYMGAPAVGHDGTVYIAKPGCEVLEVAVSTNGGASWDRRSIDPAGMAGSDAEGIPLLGLGRPATYWTNPGAAVEPSGAAVVAWGGNDGRIHLSRSTDRGGTWSPPVPVSPPGITGTSFSAVSTLGNGSVAVAYLGTRDPAWPRHEAHDAPPTTRWHLFVTFTAEADSADPLFVTLQATPDGDPVQVGCIWQAGGGEGVEPPCRNLREFIGATSFGSDLFVSYTDGCAACRSQAASDGNQLYVARIEGLPSGSSTQAQLSPSPASEPATSSEPWPLRAPTPGRRTLQ